MNQLEQAKILMVQLIKNNYSAYLVGGCVRDILLSRTPHDYDITTNATPDQIKQVFQKYKILDVGIKYGTITIIIDKVGYEITTFRTEKGYNDFRHPDNIDFTTNINDDLKRRDFTINAMAMDIDGNIIDPYNGQSDLQNKLINTVGNPNERYNEDPLRMMRAIRFATTLNFVIQDIDSIKSNSSLINNISKERIRDEFKKIIISDNPHVGIDLLKESGLLSTILPEVSRLIDVSQNNRWHYTDVYHHTLDALKYSVKFSNINDTKKLYVRLALLLHDTGKFNVKTIDDNGYEHFYNHPEESYKIAKDILHRMRFSTEEADLICKLVLYHDEPLTPSNRQLLKIIDKYKFSFYEFRLLGYIKESDISAHNKRQNDDRMKIYFTLIKMYEDRLKASKLFTIDKLNIDGNTIMQVYNLKPSRLIGDIKQHIFEYCFYHPDENNEESLKRYLLQHKKEILEKYAKN